MVEIENIRPPQPARPVRERKREKSAAVEKPRREDQLDDEDKPLIDEYA